MRIVRGFPDSQRKQVAALFWQAFASKLGRLLAPERKALIFIERALSPDHAISAQTDEGALLGVAGVKTRAGGLVTAGFGDMANVYGTIGALWRSPLLDLMERPLAENELLMDGLFVDPSARGMGVGTALIDAVVEEAARRSKETVRLDVTNTNLRARALYERYGFTASDRVNLGIYAPLFGFHHATTMRLWVDGQQAVPARRGGVGGD